MSEVKHTPGPWRALEDDDRHAADIIPIKDANGFEVCEVYGWETNAHPRMTIGEAEANAHLIAAAPELHAALDGWVRYLDVQSAGSAAEEERLLTAMRAALAKARGEA